MITAASTLPLAPPLAELKCEINIESVAYSNNHCSAWFRQQIISLHICPSVQTFLPKETTFFINLRTFLSLQTDVGYKSALQCAIILLLKLLKAETEDFQVPDSIASWLDSKTTQNVGRQCTCLRIPVAALTYQEHISSCYCHRSLGFHSGSS